MRKHLITVFLVAVLLFVFGSLAGGFYMVDVALNNADRTKDSTLARFDYMKKDYPEIAPWLDSLITVQALRDTFVTLNNGHRYHAIYARNPKANGRTAIIVHGYKDKSVGLMNIAYLYHDKLDMNVFLPDLYAHGLSDGDEVRMGWLDSYDIVDWAQRLEPVFRVEGCESKMVLHGLSMGAATVMFASGHKALPAHVKAVVEDCGYVGVWSEFKHELKRKYHLPAFPILYAANIITKMKSGWTFSDASAPKQVRKSKVPMLFIHGGNDDFVPTGMVIPCYNACARPDKELWIAEGSEHAAAYADHKGDYFMRLLLFTKKAFSNTNK